MPITVAVFLVLLLRFTLSIGLPQDALISRITTHTTTITTTRGTSTLTLTLLSTLSSTSTFGDTASSTSEHLSAASVLVGPPLVAGPATSTSTWTYVSVGTYPPTPSVTSSSAPSIVSPSSPSFTAAVQPVIRTITVGKGANQFEPNQIVADVGDIVTFEFYPVNHSVVQAEFGYPCIPISTMNADLPTFFSGFSPVSAVSSNPPTWNLTINDTAPILFYCSAPGSCIDYGMVGGINLNATTPLATQIMRAKTQDIMLQPGEPFQSEAEASSVSSMVSAATMSAASVSNSTVAGGANKNHKGALLSPGAIAGVVVAGFVVLGLLGTLVWFWSRSRTLKHTLDTERKTTEEVVNSLNSAHQQYPQHQQIPTSPSGPSAFFPSGFSAGGFYNGNQPLAALRTGSVSSGHTFGPGGGSVRSPVSPVAGMLPAAELEAKLNRRPGDMSSTAISEVAGDEPARQEFG